MAAVNPLSREVVFKIVYYGPGLGGKTTTLEHLHETASPEHRGKLISLATPVDRTLYFDFLPVRLPPVRKMGVRLQLFTVPGQVYFNATRKLVLTGADGVVFVSDSQPARADANLESLENLRENLADQGRQLDQVPLVFQHNKRDLEGALPLDELDAMLNPFGAPSIGACARTGLGVYEVLEAISRHVMAEYESEIPESFGGRVDLGSIEGGLAQALRRARDLDAMPASPPAITRVSPQSSDWGEMPMHTTIDLDTFGRDDDDNLAPIEAPAPASETTPPPPQIASEPTPVRLAPPRAAPSLSFAELWPTSERPIVRELEESLEQGLADRAVELCEVLVSRVFAATAGAFGSADAPREPALLPLLLGLDGRRYLRFRAIVHEARSGVAIDRAKALCAYAFAIDARIAKRDLGG